LSKYRVKPLDPHGLKTHPLSSRKSLVSIEDFASVVFPDKAFDRFSSSLPNILAGRDFRLFLDRMQGARESDKPILFGLGAHVIKVGLNPILIDLMENGWISGLALNGAGIIHDFELAVAGKTSEDVEIQIQDGRFGMSEETGQLLNRAAIEGAGKGVGLGEAVGRLIADSDWKWKEHSLLARAFLRSIPVTVHVAIGTDITHFHPQVSGEALGKTSLQDFFLFSSLVEQLEGGGIYVNVGSAVILPEVFLKSVTFVRNKGRNLSEFSTAVFDFNRHYRPEQNVVKRPVGKKGKGFYFVGHHEIMLPLLAACLKSIP
jgi:hypothetical protein